jgi:hypothetical protein
VTAELLAEHVDARVYHADWRALLDVVRDAGGCDALIVDAPYSERTHSKQRHGRRDGAQWVETEARWATARGIAYDAWSDADVASFVEAWAPMTRGWIVSITDSELYPAWRDSMRGTGRYVFAPLPVVQRGMNCRLAGDGPSSWTCWAIVSRPRGEPYSKWGTLPGAYLGNAFDPGENTATAERRSLVVGGKPRWVMEALVRDYSRPGDLVVDPCCGAGTTLVAAQRNGRRSIGGDAMREHAELAAKRISKPAQQPLFGGAA